MSEKMSAEEKYDFAISKLKAFKGYVEIAEFRKFSS